MGEEGWFAEEVRRIMNTPDGKAFRKQWKELASKGVYMDRKLMNNIQYELSAALRQAKQFAESQIADAEAIEEQQWINDEIEDATRLGDVERVLELQQ